MPGGPCALMSEAKIKRTMNKMMHGHKETRTRTTNNPMRSMSGTGGAEIELDPRTHNLENTWGDAHYLARKFVILCTLAWAASHLASWSVSHEPGGRSNHCTNGNSRIRGTQQTPEEMTCLLTEHPFQDKTYTFFMSCCFLFPERLVHLRMMPSPPAKIRRMGSGCRV